MAANSVLARIGNVLYWIACAFALFWFIETSVRLVIHHAPITDPLLWFVLVVPSVVAWLIGRTLRYILAGR